MPDAVQEGPRGRVKRPSPVSTRVDTGQRGKMLQLPVELYEPAREAWLRHGTAKAVRLATGLEADAAQRLIDSGYPEQGIPSLRSLARIAVEKLEKKLRQADEAAASEQSLALTRALEERVASQRRARADQQRVLGDAEAARAEEARLTRINRRSALAMAQANTDLLRAAVDLAKSVVEDLPTLRTRSVETRVGVLRTISSIVHKTAQASQVAVQMEHLLMGQPTAIIGTTQVPSGPSADMTPEEAERWFLAAQRAFQRRAGRTKVVEALVAERQGQGERDEAVDELVEDL